MRFFRGMLLFFVLQRSLSFQLLVKKMPRIIHKNSISFYGYNTTYTINDSNNINKMFGKLRKFEGCGLDINCKSGETTKRMSMKFPELKIYGVDGNKYSIELAKKKYHLLNFVNMEFEMTNYIPQESFRLVQVSDYIDIINMFSKAIHILEVDGLMMLSLKSNKDQKIIQNFLEEHGKFLNYHIYDDILFCFK